MEKYIETALESCVIKDIDKLQVLVMNDGSRDNTEGIVKSYTEKYPESFFLINKVNGGWGSNVNLAVTLAEGKYVKLLDADDWFDSEALQRFVEFLSDCDYDAISNMHYESYVDHEVVETPVWEDLIGKRVEIGNIPNNVFLAIWDSTFKTSIVKKYHKELPEHTLYTDTLFIYQICAGLTNVYFSDYKLYHYRLDRNGQSVSLDSIAKHYKEHFDVTYRMVKKYSDPLYQGNNLVIGRVAWTYTVTVRYLVLLNCTLKMDVKCYVSKLEEEIKKYPELVARTNTSLLLRLIRKNYRFALALYKLKLHFTNGKKK